MLPHFCTLDIKRLLYIYILQPSSKAAKKKKKKRYECLDYLWGGVHPSAAGLRSQRWKCAPGAASNRRPARCKCSAAGGWVLFGWLRRHLRCLLSQGSAVSTWRGMQANGPVCMATGGHPAATPLCAAASRLARVRTGSPFDTESGCLISNQSQ